MTDLTDLAAEWRRVVSDLPERAGAVVGRGAYQVMRDWRDSAAHTAAPHARLYPSSITYDRNGLDAEIGPDKTRRQGALGNLLEFGSVNNAPHLDGQKALDREDPRFERAMGDLIDEMMMS